MIRLMSWRGPIFPLLVAATLGVALLAVSSFSTAAEKRMGPLHHATALQTLQNLRTSPDYPAARSNATLTGVVKRFVDGKRRSNGAAVVNNTITDVSGGTVYTSRTRFRTFYAEGTHFHVGMAVATLQPDGTILLEGKGRITSGTGRYRGIEGSYTATGRQTCLDCPIKLVGKANYRLPR